MNFQRLVAPVVLMFALAAVSPIQAASILLVTNNNGSLTAAENTVKTQLESWGHTVNTVWDNASQATYDAAFPSNSVVYVPRSVSPGQVSYKLRETTLGVVSEEQGLTDEMGFSSSGGGTNSASSVNVIDNTHYITTPFSTGALSVSSSSITLSRMGGTTASGANVLATLSGNNSLVAVNSGATLANTYNGSNTAFGRRVHSPINLGNNLGTLMSSGLTLVERAVAWAAVGQNMLVAHWKLNESSGTTAADATGSGHTGSVTGTASWVPAVLNNGSAFDGATKIEASGLMGSPTNVTVAAWANLTAADTNGAEVISLGDRFVLRLDEGGTSGARLYNGSSWVTVTVGTNYAGTGWHHFAAVFDNANDVFRLYVDGVSVATTSTTSNISYSGGGSNTVIGRHGNASTSYDFTGTIDDVRVYNYPLTASQVAELYGFVGHWELAETSGTTAADSTVFADNGTVTGGAGWSTDCGGMGVFDFNGSTQYISIPSASHLQPTGMLSIAAWIKGDAWSAGSDVDAILRKGEGNPNNYELDVADGKVELVLDGNDDAGAQSATTLSTGQWYHVAATWDGATVKIYVNGALDSSTARTGTIGTDTRPLYIGGRSGTDFLDGMMRDVRLYNRPLLAEEVTKLAGQSGHWRFNEGVGATAADSSGLGNNATLVGGATWTNDCAGNSALLTNGAGGIAQTGAAFSPPDAGTVAFWMRSNGNPVARSRIIGSGGDWEARQEPDGTLSFDLCGEGPPDFVTTVGLGEVGRWYHVCVTYDAADDSYAVYLDGQLHKSGTNGTNMVAQNAAILSFGTRTGSTEYWQGALRDFRVYNRKLCPSEISQLYSLIGDWKLDETTGTTAFDSSLAGNNGTYQNGVSLAASTPVPGSGAIAAVFDGVDDYVSVANESTYDVSGPITAAVWIKVSSFTKTWQAIFTKGDSAWRLSRNGTSNTIHFACTGLSQFQVNGTRNVNDGQWHHLAGVYDGSSLILYVDGVVDASVSSAGSISTNNYNVEIGRNAQASGREFHGAVYDARVYNRALCPVEVQALYGGSGFQGVRIIKWVEIQ